MENIERKTVKLTLTSKQFVPEIVHRMNSLSLFNNKSNARLPGDSADIAPEDFDERELEEAVQGVFMNSMEMGFGDPMELDAEYPLPYGDDSGDFDEEIDDIAEDIRTMIMEFGDRLRAAEEEDADSYVFCTLASMTSYTENGSEVIEVSYAEEESLDGTNTVIRYEANHPNTLTIYRNGGIMSTLICEKGVRHISSYQTPFMPLEAAIFTRKCDGSLSTNGGTVELDYIVELRGAEMQRTIMKIDVTMLEV